MVSLTGVGIYIVVIYVLGIAANLFYAGAGGTEIGPGTALFGALWGIVNLWLLLNYGFNV